MDDVERELAALRRRVESLETRLAAIEPDPGHVAAPGATAPGFPAGPPIAAPPPPPVGAPPRVGAPPPPPGPPVVGGGPARPNLIQRRPVVAIDAETVFKWAGLGLVVLAALFLVSTAIDRGWIGPELQLAGATVGGLALVAGGWRLEGVNRAWAEALTVGGAVVLPLCAAASSAGLDLLGAEPALIWLAATIVALAAVAVATGHESVAWVSALMSVGLIMWVGDDADLAVLVVGTWLTVTGLGSGALALARRWRVTRLVAVTSSGFLLLVAIASHDALAGVELVLALVAGGLLASMVWAGPALAMRFNGVRTGPLAVIDHRSAIYAPLGLWALVGAAVRFDESDPLGWAGLAIAAASAGLALALFIRAARPLLTTHLMGASILGSIAVAVLADGPTVLVAVAVQAAALALLAHRFEDVLAGAQAGAMATFALAWAGVSMVEGLFEASPLGQHLANLTVVALTVGATVYLHRLRLRALVPLGVVVGWVGALLWVADITIHGPQGQVVVSILWAVAAAGAVAVGVRQGLAGARVLGLATLAVVLAKLLTIDLAEVDTLWRVGLFFVIGTGLLRLGYLLPRLSGTGTGTDPGTGTGTDPGIGTGPSSDADDQGRPMGTSPLG